MIVKQCICSCNSVASEAAQHVWRKFGRSAALRRRWSSFQLCQISFHQFTRNPSGAFHNHTHYTSITSTLHKLLTINHLPAVRLMHYCNSCVFLTTSNACVHVNHAVFSEGYTRKKTRSGKQVWTCDLILSSWNLKEPPIHISALNKTLHNLIHKTTQDSRNIQMCENWREVYLRKMNT